MDFGSADASFAALEPELTQESDETYLLSPGADAAVKIRAGLMDIKLLEEVDADGLRAVAARHEGDVPLAARRGGQGLRSAGRQRTVTRNGGLLARRVLGGARGTERGVRSVAVRKRRQALHGQ